MRKFALLLIIVGLLTACSPAAHLDASLNGIEISNARVLLPGGDAMSGMDTSLAAFLMIKNTAAMDDRLLGVSTDFGEASLHETKTEGNVMKMDAITGVDVPAGQMVELRSGSYHVMIMKNKNIKVNDSVTLVLEFEKAGRITVPAKVTDK